jgi:hypothetical protein
MRRIIFYWFLLQLSSRSIFGFQTDRKASKGHIELSKFFKKANFLAGSREDQNSITGLILIVKPQSKRQYNY